MFLQLTNVIHIRTLPCLSTYIGNQFRRSRRTPYDPRVCIPGTNIMPAGTIYDSYQQVHQQQGWIGLYNYTPLTSRYDRIKYQKFTSRNCNGLETPTPHKDLLKSRQRLIIYYTIYNTAEYCSVKL